MSGNPCLILMDAPSFPCPLHGEHGGEDPVQLGPMPPSGLLSCVPALGILLHVPIHTVYTSSQLGYLLQPPVWPERK